MRDTEKTALTPRLCSDPPARPTATIRVLPVKALCFSSDGRLLFAAIGPALTVYSCRDTSELWAGGVLEEDIHGIVCQPLAGKTCLALLWGGRSICAVTMEFHHDGLDDRYGCTSVKTSDVLTCDDWILDCVPCSAVPSDSRGPFRAALVTAHNALIGLSISGDLEGMDGSNSQIRITTISLTSPSRVLCYSAHVRWLQGDLIEVAAGTAFGTVILWTYTADAETSQAGGSTDTYHLFPAHPDGAVFGICLLDAPAQGRDTPFGRLLATCSDDRTLRVWVRGSRDGKDTSKQEESDQPRLEPGTGVSSLVEPATLLAQASPGDPRRKKGHISRIWGITSVPAEGENPEDDCITLISNGEDATCQVWDLVTVSTSPALQLSHRTTFLDHNGKNVWACAVTHTHDGAKIASGGADGRIVVKYLDASGDNEQVIVTEDDASSSEANQSFRELQTALKSFCLLSRDKVLGIRKNGTVISYPLTTCVGLSPHPGHMVHSVQLFREKEATSYAVVTSIPSVGIGFIGSASGKIYIVDKEGLREPPAASVDGKISRMFSQLLTENDPCPERGGSTLLVTTLTSAQATLLHFRPSKVNLSDDPTGGIESYPCSSTEIPLPYEFVVTSMLFTRWNMQRDTLFLGSRDGRIARYSIEQSTNPVPEDVRLDAISKPHCDAVTSMHWHLKEDHQVLLITSRDGSYALQTQPLDVSSGRETLQPDILHQSTLPFGPYIEGYFIRDDGSLCFYGFQSEHFIVYDESHKDELWRVHCGGAHRLWRFNPPETSQPHSVAAFAWMQATKLQYATSTLKSHIIVAPGGHGREIKAVAATNMVCGQDRIPTRCIATGAEDTDIRLWSYDEDNTRDTDPHLRNVTIMKRHNTGIQQLQWLDNGKYLLTCGGLQEFFIWKVVPAPLVQLGVTCIAHLPLRNSASGLAKGLYEEHNTVARRSPPEVRIMGFDIIRHNGEEDSQDLSYDIAMIFSDSTIRVYRFYPSRTQTDDTKMSLLQFLTSKSVSDHCLTSIQAISPRDEAMIGGFVTGSTDGHFGLWKFSGLLSSGDSWPVYKQFLGCVHQGSIKDLAVIPFSVPRRKPSQHERHLVISAGDDNALAFHIMVSTGVSGGDSQMGCTSLLVANAHTASINAVGVVSHHEDRPGDDANHIIRIATASNDQRLKIWDITVRSPRSIHEPRSKGMKVRLVQNIASAVADVSSLIVLPKEIKNGEANVPSSQQVEILICGVGMEVWPIRVRAGDSLPTNE